MAGPLHATLDILGILEAFGSATGLDQADKLAGADSCCADTLDGRADPFGQDGPFALAGSLKVPFALMTPLEHIPALASAALKNLT